MLVEAADGNLAGAGLYRHTLAMMRVGRDNGGDAWDRCTYRHDPAELCGELRVAGFAAVQVVGVERPVGAFARHDPALHEHAMELARDLRS